MKIPKVLNHEWVPVRVNSHMPGELMWDQTPAPTCLDPSFVTYCHKDMVKGIGSGLLDSVPALSTV